MHCQRADRRLYRPPHQPGRGKYQNPRPEAKDLIHDTPAARPAKSTTWPRCLIHALPKPQENNESLVNETMSEFICRRRRHVEILSDRLLRALRNKIPIHRLITEILGLPLRRKDPLLRFRCPACTASTRHPSENQSGTLLDCQKNFNPIDLVMAATQCGFVDAVELLRKLPGADMTPPPC